MNIPQAPFVDATLSRTFAKWRFYKRAFIFFVCVNVFSVATSMVLAVKYFGFQHDYGAQQVAEIHRVAKIDAGLGQLQAFILELQTHTALDIRSTEDEKHILQLLEAWSRIKNYAQEIHATTLPVDFSPLINTPENAASLRQIATEFQTIKAATYNALEQRLTTYRSNMRELLVIGFITLLFGLILPLLCLYLLGRALNGIRREMQAAALRVVGEWSETRLQFGEGAFRNMEFWLKMLCLAGEQTRHLSYHPAAQVVSEFAFLIRHELAKRDFQKEQAGGDDVSNL